MNEIQSPSICVIIVSYNFEPWIDKCLSSIHQSTIPATVVVIDNASQDNTCAIIRAKYTNVILIENKQNWGFGRANNIGFEYAIKNNFEYVFLLNQDAWLQPDALQILVKSSRNNPDFGILSPVHLNGKGDKPDFGFSNYTGVKSVEDIFLLPSQAIECAFINAAMWLIPLSVLQIVGYFAPIFSHYGEDLNFSQRLRKKGFKIGFVRLAIGYHDRESREISREKFFYSEYVYFLTEAVNVNYTPLQSFAYSVLAAKKKALKSLFAGDFSAFGEYISICTRLLKESVAIKHTRRKFIPK